MSMPIVSARAGSNAMRSCPSVAGVHVKHCAHSAQKDRAARHRPAMGKHETGYARIERDLYPTPAWVPIPPKLCSAHKREFSELPNCQLSKRSKRLRRGRPPRDYSDDPDQSVAELEIALQAAWGLSERKALDLALAVDQGEPGTPSKIPRGVKAGVLVGYALPQQKSFSSRSADIRRKLKSGKLRPRAEVVLAIARLLHRIRTFKG